MKHGRRPGERRDRAPRDRPAPPIAGSIPPSTFKRSAPEEVLAKYGPASVVRWGTRLLTIPVGGTLGINPWVFSKGATAFYLTGSSDHALNRQAFSFVTLGFVEPQQALIDDEVIGDTILGSGGFRVPLPQYVTLINNQQFGGTVRNRVGVQVVVSLALWVVTGLTS